MKKADPPLNVQIPPQGADQPSWLRVGVVALIGFAVGVAWPRLAGVKLGPSAPATTQEQLAPAASTAPVLAKAPPSAARAAEPSPTASLVAPTAAASEAPSQAAGPTVVTVKPGIVIGCRTEAGEKLPGKQCGTTSFDTLALPRLRKLASCPAAAGADGKLSPQFHLDFVNSKFTVQMGHKNTVENIDSFSACLGTLFEKVSINAVTHEHQRYSIQYNVTFGKGESGSRPRDPAAAAAPVAAAPSADSGEAKIAYDVAIVRDAPRTGQIVGRIQQGTPVQVLATENSWYKVRGNGTEGWVYRGAIGR